MKRRPRVLVAQESTLPAFPLRDFIVNEVSALASLRDALATTRPDVALISLDLPGLGGARGLRELSKISPATKVVAVTQHADDAEELDALRNGARGYVRADETDPLPKVIEKVDDGELWAARRTIGRLFDEVFFAEAPHIDDDKLRRLTTRERQILALITEGATNKEIAAALQVSVATVKAHLTSIFKKLGQPDRLNLAIHVRTWKPGSS